MLMENTQPKCDENQIAAQTATQKKYINLSREFQKHLSEISHKNGVIDQGKYRKRPVKN